MLALRREATFSPSREWRYSLRRYWDDRLPKACFIMLNPSVANEHHDDPTTTQCLKRVIKEGYGSYEAVNLFALVSTSPSELKQHPQPIGLHNDEFIQTAVANASLIVVAWGAGGNLYNRGNVVLKLLSEEALYCLGKNLYGTPRFPLRVPYSQPFIPFDMIGAGR